MIRTPKLILPVAGNMKDEVALLATVTLVGVLLQGGLAPVWEVGGSYTLQPAPGVGNWVLAGLGSGEGLEASRLGPWYQGPSNSRTVGVLGVGGPKSQLRSPHFPGVGVVSTREDQVKDGHPAEGTL